MKYPSGGLGGAAVVTMALLQAYHPCLGFVSPPGPARTFDHRRQVATGVRVLDRGSSSMAMFGSRSLDTNRRSYWTDAASFYQRGGQCPKKNDNGGRLYAGFLGQDEEEDGGGVDKKEKYEQTMSSDERRENLKIIRQIFNEDLEALQQRRDYAGWVEAKKDMKRRQADDPWFELNGKLKEAVQLDAPEEEVLELQQLLQKVGGPPPGIKHRRAYAVASEIYDTGMSLGRAEAIAEMEQRKLNHAKWQAMIKERKANEAKEQEMIENENPYLRQEEEARKRREKMYRMVYSKVEEERKKKEERAREIQEKYGLDKDDLSVGSGTGVGGMSALDRAIESAKSSLEGKKKDLLGPDADTSSLSSSCDEDGKSKDSADAKSSGGGQPRVPGDMDITRGEINESVTSIQDYSDVTTSNVRVQVSSGYNANQSDPPMRKHVFTYTIKITNLNERETIQLTLRRFEIQTVGARQKDVVSGQGVTGRQPILRPGETFEYTSTAPLSVRPIGTTIVAARMKGEYEFNIVDIIEEAREGSNTEAKVSVRETGRKCDLDTFHFIFPEGQRVKPVKRSDEDDDDDDDEDEDTTPKAKASSAPAAAAKKAASASTPSLPGDEDIKSGSLSIQPKDISDTTTNDVRVTVSSEYKPERSDPTKEKHVFSYSIRITNNNAYTVKLVGRRFEIQTIGSPNKDVVSGEGVTGRYPVLKPGESFEYTSTAPLSVKPNRTTPVVATMGGYYSFVKVEGDNAVDAPPSKGQEGKVMEATLGAFHFMLPALDVA